MVGTATLFLLCSLLILFPSGASLPSCTSTVEAAFTTVFHRRHCLCLSPSTMKTGSRNAGASHLYGSNTERLYGWSLKTSYSAPLTTLMQRQNMHLHPLNRVLPNGRNTFSSSTQLALFDFFRKKKNDGEDDGDEEKVEDISTSKAKVKENASTEQFYVSKTTSSVEQETYISDDAQKSKGADTAVAVEVKGEMETVNAKAKPVGAVAEDVVQSKRKELEKDKDDVRARARAMKREAARVRMEAERMEAELTLEKITSLEKKLKAMTRDGIENEKDPKKLADVKDQIAALKAKLEPDVDTTTPRKQGSADSVSSVVSAEDVDLERDLSPEELKERTEEFLKTPKFLRQLTARAAGFEDDSNATAVVEKMYREEIEFMRNQRSMDKGEKGASVTTGKESGQETPAFGLFQNLGDELEKGRTDAMVESLLPKSTRKDGEAPTEDDVNTFIRDALGTKTFNPTGKPEKVSGGYIIRGQTRMEKNNVMIEAIDTALEKSRARTCLSYFFIPDPTPISEEQIMVGSRDPVIFVTGKDVSAESNLIGRAILTALSIASVGLFSIFPFFLNEAVAGRLDETITLGQAGGPADLSWFNDLTSPIFFSVLAIQLVHEGGHFLAAAGNKFEISFPTLIPSPIFGFTSAVTRLKTSPKNRQALFDFALAGPLAGMVCSFVALLLGLQLTAYIAATDAASFANLPVLPASFLRASTLVSGIAEQFVGSGFIQTSDPVNTLVKLHPLAVAGYAGMIVNALNLTPYGRTDGGRLALALFGRSGTQLLGLITSITLLVSGFVSSDAFLLHFLYVTFFQGELEIPIRNEVDEVGFPRVALATATAILVLLTLIPVL